MNAIKTLQVQLDEEVFRFSAEADRNGESSLTTFTRRLKQQLKDSDIVPLPGLELQQSLEAFMKLARFHFESMPEFIGRIRTAETLQQRLETSRELCEEVMAMSIWLRNINVPMWMYRWVRAPIAFQLTAQLADEAGNESMALHWTVALLVAPSTRLGYTDAERPLMRQDDVQRLIRLERSKGAGAIQDELEAWHDLFSSYRLFN